MIFLTSTDVIQLTASVAVTSIDVQIGFLDLQGSTLTPGRQNTKVTVNTATTIVSSPNPGVQRNIRGATIRNASGTLSTVTLVHLDGTINPTMISVALNPGDQLQYTTDDGWIVLLAAGGISTTLSNVAAGSITGILTLPHGGTGSDLSGTGGAHQFVKQITLGANLSVAQITAGDLVPALATPQVSVLTGSGTYNVPAGALWLEVEGIGGGGGGAGSGTTPGAATAGGNTTFGTSLLTGNGGALGTTAGGSAAGGTASGGDVNITGEAGGASETVANEAGGDGGAGTFGGRGAGGQIGTAGGAAAAATGAGGGGAGDGATVNSGGGGGAGGYFRKAIASPAASYAYAVGAAGGAGTAGTGGFAGGAGAAGTIIVTAYFQ